MEAIIKSLKKMKKDDIINIIKNVIELDNTVEIIFEALLMEDGEQKFDAFHDLTSALLRINDMNEVDLSRSLKVISTYSELTNDLPGVVVLKLNFIVAAIRFMGLLNENAYGVEEAEDKLTEVFEDTLKSAKELDGFDEVGRLIFTILVLTKMAEYPHYEEFKQLTINYMGIDGEQFENTLAELMTNMLNAEFNDDDFEEDEDYLDSIFGDDEEDEDYDEEDEPQPIRKATPKEKITKLF